MTIPRMGQEKQMISQELYQEILNSCGLSQAMKEHLEKQDLSKHDLIKLLVNAPVALTKKLTLMEQIAETEDLYEEMLEQVNRLLPGEKGHFFEWQSVWQCSAMRLKGEIQKAIDALQLGEGEMQHHHPYDSPSHQLRTIVGDVVVVVHDDMLPQLTND